MKVLSIHWPSRHVTDARVEALRACLAAHPGDDQVEVHLTGVTARLGVTVNAEAPGLALAVQEACEVQGAAWVRRPELEWP